MGCRNSKVLPEPPEDVKLDLVKKVDPQPQTDIYKHFIRGDGSGSKMGVAGGGAGDKAEITSPHQAQSHTATPTASAHLPKDLSELPDPQRRKVAKYRAKFDPRVTAKYEIKALIGRGSFSRVVRVEHKSTRQPYAIKMIETRYREGREVCESELCVLRRVRHTNIIQLMEVFETAERVYMVMELATGGELFDRIIARGSFTERDATRVLQMVLDGVKYLHTLGITHRDLKPENLLYYHPGPDSKIIITDFGLASSRKKGGECLMKTTCGTPEYIAPEILVRKPYTNAVDMWALGVISYILMSGTMPFEDDNRMRLYRQILKGKYSFSGEPWPSVSNLAKDFVERVLTVDPSERLTAGQALKHPWIVSMAASSSMKNLQRCISHNLLKRASSRCHSTKSSQSTRSSRSTKSNKARRVREKELRELNRRYQQQYDG
ncbi:serine/threonine-protein kinase H1 homolog [Maylandia zebra]|uniref:Protein serine kinase H1 n=3 Tax=Haplochromini TaxID=319058 RepID=A0A3Q2VBP4_HAPBU|nr:serine/threonine-protein kinase H1 [Maylandia zebra]XP_005935073.1 serine/threonine-protein kinase H1 homolog [Haplochromis burtoni]XP_026028748.1 serine/threonine-protein kinase H1 [Astatotilapia calliptera]